jgi:hypothetical protein
MKPLPSFLHIHTTTFLPDGTYVIRASTQNHSLRLSSFWWIDTNNQPIAKISPEPVEDFIVWYDKPQATNEPRRTPVIALITYEDTLRIMRFGEHPLNATVYEETDTCAESLHCGIPDTSQFVASWLSADPPMGIVLTRQQIDNDLGDRWLVLQDFETHESQVLDTRGAFPKFELPEVLDLVQTHHTTTASTFYFVASFEDTLNTLEGTYHFRFALPCNEMGYVSSDFLPNTAQLSGELYTYNIDRRGPSWSLCPSPNSDIPDLRFTQWFYPSAGDLNALNKHFCVDVETNIIRFPYDLQQTNARVPINPLAYCTKIQLLMNGIWLVAGGNCVVWFDAALQTVIDRIAYEKPDEVANSFENPTTGCLLLSTRGGLFEAHAQR